MINGTKNKKIIKDVEHIKLCEEMELEVNEEGRYPCRAPDCTKTFAHSGRSRRNHEASHNPPVIIAKPNVPLLDAKPPPTEKDDMLSYQKALLEYGLLLLNFWDAVSEGDGIRIFRSWKYFLLYLQNEGSSATKYSLEALYLMCQVNALLSPQAAHRLIWNRSVKNKTGRGGNIPLDLQLEFYNRILKGALKNLGHNASKKSLDRICHAMGVTNQLLHNFDREAKIIKRSGKHVKQSTQGDLSKVVGELVSQKAMHLTPGRTYNCFSSMGQSLLHGFNSNKLYGWINEHKRNTILNRHAR